MTAQTPLASELRLIEAARALVYRLASGEDLRAVVGDDGATALVVDFAGGSVRVVARVPVDHVLICAGQGWITGEDRPGFKSYGLTDHGKARAEAGAGRAVIADLLARGMIEEAEATAARRFAEDYAAAIVDPATAPRLTLDALDTVRHRIMPGGRVEAAIRYLADADLVAMLTGVVLFREDMALAEKRAKLPRGSGLPVLRIALRLIARSVYS